ncbi:MAG TPA: hypothetical protein VNH18_33995 [Bryobacteraceae bacterium]|nr:hypothetical protein [Bryobacteraceae bacterium]
MKRIIGLTGLPRCGKDTVASELAWFGYTRAAFADPLKDAAAILLDRPRTEVNGELGFDREKVMPEWGFSMREFLQKFGTECLRRQIRDDFWIKRMEKTLQGLEQVVITDCRFPNEAALVKAQGGVIVRIERPGCVDNGHISNQRLPYDILLENSGSLEEFQEKITCLAVTIQNMWNSTKKRPSKSKSGKRATKRGTSSKKQGRSTRATA